MAKITKQNYKKFSRKNLLPKADGTMPTGVAVEKGLRKSQELIDRASRYYSSLQEARDRADRCDRYRSGDQLSDLIPDPKGCGMITEEKYIRDQGMIPMAINIIATPVSNIVGQYVRNPKTPLVIARDRDEQKRGEMMTLTMEYIYEMQNLPQVNARAYDSFLGDAIVAFRVGYDRDDERNTSDVRVSQIDWRRMLWDDNTSGMYFENITCIGYLHDMPKSEVLKRFASSPSDRAKIEAVYAYVQATSADQQFRDKDRQRTIDFRTPLNPEHCRVIEIWTKEEIEGEEDGWLFHDTAKGEEILTTDRNDPDIIAENNRRIMEMVAAGGSPEDASLIEFERYCCSSKWVVRYLSPEGYILKEEISPYAHGSHPFVIGAYPLRNGKVHSLVERLIPIQRIYNSTMTSNRYIRMCQAKGGGAANRKILERSGVSIQQFGTAYTDPSATLELDWEPGEEVFKPFPNNANNIVDEQTPLRCLELVDKLSGNTGANRGETPNSGTPASLYAQMAENGNNNIADIEKWFNGLIAKRDYKIMMVAQQFYKDRRPIRIAGKHYTEESMYYDPEKIKNSMFDLSLVESQTQGVFRAQNENLLISLLQSQMIDLETYLEMSTTPFADKMLERIKAKREEAAQQQAEQDAAAQQQALTQAQAAQLQQAQQAAALQQGAAPAAPNGAPVV